MARLRPVPAARHASPATFVHKDLKDCNYVFLRQDAVRRALEPPYSGPYQVLSRQEKTFKILVRGRSVTVSADRVKPAYTLNETDHGPTHNKPAATPTAATASPTMPTRPSQTPALSAKPSPPAAQTTRAGRHVRFPARYRT
jgi:hypothetical protein